MEDRSCRQQGFQHLGRFFQGHRRQQMPDLRRQNAIQSSSGRNQHRPAGCRVPQRVARIQQRRQLRRPAAQENPHRDQLSLQPVPGCSPEDHMKHDIGSGGGNQQHSGVHIGIKNTAHHRHAAARQQPKCQHTPSHAAGNSKEQKCQAQKFFFTAVSNQSHQHSRRKLHRSPCEKRRPWQKYHHCIDSAQKRRQKISPTPQRHPRKAPGG